MAQTAHIERKCDEIGIKIRKVYDTFQSIESLIRLWENSKVTKCPPLSDIKEALSALLVLDEGFTTLPWFCG